MGARRIISILATAATLSQANRHVRGVAPAPSPAAAPGAPGSAGEWDASFAGAHNDEYDRTHAAVESNMTTADTLNPGYALKTHDDMKHPMIESPAKMVPPLAPAPAAAAPAPASLAQLSGAKPKGPGIPEDTKAIACAECAAHAPYLDRRDTCVCHATDVMGTFENDATKELKSADKYGGTIANTGDARLAEGWHWHCRPVTGTDGVWQQC